MRRWCELQKGLVFTTWGPLPWLENLNWTYLSNSNGNIVFAFTTTGLKLIWHSVLSIWSFICFSMPFVLPVGWFWIFTLQDFRPNHVYGKLEDLVKEPIIAQCLAARERALNRVHEFTNGFASGCLSNDMAPCHVQCVMLQLSIWNWLLATGIGISFFFAKQSSNGCLCVRCTKRWWTSRTRSCWHWDWAQAV